METKENNKLIAEFMGTCRAYDGNYTGEFSIIEHGGISYTKNNGRDHVTDGAIIRISYAVEELLYNKSWDWLMPVVEKIDDMFTEKYSVSVVMESLNQSIITIHFHQPDPTKKRIVKQFINTSESKISSLYKTIVEFIKWYNANK